MVRTIVRLAALGAMVLSLAACDAAVFVLDSVFPATTTLQSGRADLSGVIGSGEGDSFKLRVVEGATKTWVVLMSTGGSGTGGARAYIYDTSLTLLKSLTGKLSNGVVFDGSGVMYDGINDLVMIGNVELEPADLSVSSTQPPSGFTLPGVGGNAGVDGFFSRTDGYNVTDIGIEQGTSNLDSTVYNGTWNSLARPASYPPTLSSASGGYTLQAVLDDGRSMGTVYLAISKQDNEVTLYFVNLAKTAFSSLGGADTLDSAPHRDNLQFKSLGFAQGCITGLDSVTNSFVRIDPETMATKGSFYSPSGPGNSSSIRYAYRTDGGSFYSWDPNTRVITELTAWW